MPILVLDDRSRGSFRPSKDCLRSIASPGSHTRCLTMTAAADRGVSGGDDQLIHVWNPSTGTWMCDFGPLSDRLFSIGITADGRIIVAGTADGYVHIWALEETRCIASYKAHEGIVHSLAVTADGRWILSGGEDRFLRLWDWQSNRCIASCGGEGFGKVLCVAMTPDGRHAVSGHSLEPENVAVPRSLIHAWQLPAGNPSQEYWHFRPITGIAMTPDAGLVVSSDTDGQVQIWGDKTTPRLVLWPGGAVAGVSVTADGRFAATCGNSLRIWRVRDGCSVRDFSLGVTSEPSMAMSADGSILAVASYWGDLISICESEQAGPSNPVSGHKGPPKDLKLAGLNRLLIIEDDDSLVLKDSETEEELTARARGP